MQPSLLVRLRPNGPWRYGPDDGGQSRTDKLFRSDRLFSALTVAAKQLGFRDQWLSAMGQPQPALALSSLFPFQGDTLFVSPPANLWPPPSAIVTSPSPVFLSKIRWAAARFVPVSLVESILRSQNILADQWAVDPESECLLRRDRPSSTPFRAIVRQGAPVDRLTRTSAAAYSAAGIEFEPGAGLWMAVRFSDDSAQAEWSPRVKGMLRLLADSGLGGRRTSGWGHAHAPEFQDGAWPQILFPKLRRNTNADSSNLHWLLSLYSPGDADSVNWSGGVYNLIERGSPSGVRTRFVVEGSVLESASELAGGLVDGANGKGKKRLYRSGLALSLQLPEWQLPESPEQEPARTVEEPSDTEALEGRPCETAQLPEPQFEDDAAPEAQTVPGIENLTAELHPETEPPLEPEALPETVGSSEPEAQAPPALEQSEGAPATGDEHVPASEEPSSEI